MEREWPAEDYEIGSYIQATGADLFLPQLKLKETDNVLDVGCGSGAYTRKILEKVPQGSVLGIDSSENMLKLAQKVITDYPHFSVKKENVLTMKYENKFDQIVSFWCLQWATDIVQAFANMLKALKKNGKIFALFPAGDDPFILAYYALRDSDAFTCLNNFKPPVDYSKFNHLEDKLAPLSDKKITVVRQFISIKLPNLDMFRRFVNGIAFYQTQVSEKEIQSLNEAMISWYQTQCMEKYQGEYPFNFSLYLVTAEK